MSETLENEILEARAETELGKLSQSRETRSQCTEPCRRALSSELQRGLNFW